MPPPAAGPRERSPSQGPQATGPLRFPPREGAAAEPAAAVGNHTPQPAGARGLGEGERINYFLGAGLHFLHSQTVASPRGRAPLWGVWGGYLATGKSKNLCSRERQTPTREALTPAERDQGTLLTPGQLRRPLRSLGHHVPFHVWLPFPWASPCHGTLPGGRWRGASSSAVAFTSTPGGPPRAALGPASEEERVAEQACSHSAQGLQVVTISGK